MNGQVIDSFEPDRKGFATWLDGWVKRWRAGERIAVLVDVRSGHAVVVQK